MCNSRIYILYLLLNQKVILSIFFYKVHDMIHRQQVLAYKKVSSVPYFLEKPSVFFTLLLLERIFFHKF